MIIVDDETGLTIEVPDRIYHLIINHDQTRKDIEERIYTENQLRYLAEQDAIREYKELITSTEDRIHRLLRAGGKRGLTFIPTKRSMRAQSPT